jgi:hypothetical protein
MDTDPDGPSRTELYFLSALAIAIIAWMAWMIFSD